MGSFKYYALDAQGQERKGTIEAESENEANARLREKGLYPTGIAKDRSNKRREKPVESKDERERILAARVTLLLILLTISVAANAVAATIWLSH